MSDNVVKIVDIDSKRPHLVIDGIGGGQYVIPVQFFIDVSLGKKSLKDLEGFEAIVPTIVREWLSNMGQAL